MTSLDRLKRLAPPPATVAFSGSPEEWMTLEAKWGMRFPKDYRELLATYGAGHFADFLGIQNPFFVSKRSTPYEKWVGLVCDEIRAAKLSYSESAVALPVYPEKGGLFPCGYTDNGDTLHWLCEGDDGDRWPIVYLYPDCCLYDRFDLPLTEFLEGWLSNGKSVPRFVPEDFSR